jgi:hypothetical protein
MPNTPRRPKVIVKDVHDTAPLRAEDTARACVPVDEVQHDQRARATAQATPGSAANIAAMERDRAEILRVAEGLDVLLPLDHPARASREEFLTHVFADIDPTTVSRRSLSNVRRAVPKAFTLRVCSRYRPRSS